MRSSFAAVLLLAAAVCHAVPSTYGDSSPPVEPAVVESPPTVQPVVESSYSATPPVQPAVEQSFSASPPVEPAVVESPPAVQPVVEESSSSSPPVEPAVVESPPLPVEAAPAVDSSYSDSTLLETPGYTEPAAGTENPENPSDVLPVSNAEIPSEAAAYISETPAPEMDKPAYSDAPAVDSVNGTDASTILTPSKSAENRPISYAGERAPVTAHRAMISQSIADNLVANSTVGGNSTLGNSTTNGNSTLPFNFSSATSSVPMFALVGAISFISTLVQL